MGNTYAFLVESSRVFTTKTVVLAANLKAALDWVEEYKAKHFKGTYDEVISIVRVGEVANG